MEMHESVLDSLILYVLYVLLPLVPAILIFKLFPDTKVTVSGPLQNLTVNATGAFAGYVVTVALGFFLVKDAQREIFFTQLHPVQGVIDLEENQVIHSNQVFTRWSTVVDQSGMYKSKQVSFIELINQPSAKTTVWLDYWELPAQSGFGAPPVLGLPKAVPVELVVSDPSPQHFIIQAQGNKPVVVKR